MRQIIFCLLFLFTGCGFSVEVNKPPDPHALEIARLKAAESENSVVNSALWACVIIGGSALTFAGILVVMIVSDNLRRRRDFERLWVAKQFEKGELWIQNSEKRLFLNC
jgi:hypothetical protein